MANFKCKLKNGQELTGLLVGENVGESQVPEGYFRYSIVCDANQKPTRIQKYAFANRYGDIICNTSINFEEDHQTNMHFVDIESWSMVEPEEPKAKTKYSTMIR